jgi:hypothetical protein
VSSLRFTAVLDVLTKRRTRFSPRWPEFNLRSVHVGFVVGKLILRNGFFQYFGFPCQFSFHQMFHSSHLSSGAGTRNIYGLSIEGVSLTHPKNKKSAKPPKPLPRIEPGRLDPRRSFLYLFSLLKFFQLLGIALVLVATALTCRNCTTLSSADHWVYHSSPNEHGLRTGEEPTWMKYQSGNP